MVADFEDMFKKEEVVVDGENRLRSSHDYMRFMSHPVNFDSNNQDDIDEIYNLSLSNVEVESLSSDS